MKMKTIMEEETEIARRAGYPDATVHDAGKTQIAHKTFTAVGIGPAKSEKLDEITKDLKLL